MGGNAMEIRVCMQKTLITTMKTCYRSARDHPFGVSMLFFFLFLYRFLPSLFFFLVSSSPVIICTAVLLGTLLSFGNPYIPEIEEEEEEEEQDEKISHEISSLRSGFFGNELLVDKDESFSVETHVGKSRDLDEKDFVFSKKPHEDDDSVSESSSDEVDKLIKEEKRVVDEQKTFIEDENDVRAQYSSLRENETEGERMEKFDSVQYSSILRGIEDNEVSSLSEYDSESDRAESSSPDASLAEIMPMLDELHPLLDSEPSQPAVLSVEDDDDGSEESPSSSDESEDEVENVEVEEDDEEKEQKEDHNDGTEAVVTWTKEDEKNLMDLGNSEIERNRRLENLIARRRARKSFRMMMTEKNLIDLDGVDPPFQMPQISTARRNPFDIHYDSYEGMDLPPIPGSAPSALAPRRNPFDIPYDPFEEKPNLAGGSFEDEFLTSHEKETHFRRYESFSVGPSFLGEPKQGKPASKFKPYFEPEQVHSAGIGYPTFQRQLSEISESKMSSVTETESISSVSDQDNKENIAEETLSQPIALVEEEPSQPITHVERSLDHVESESSSSEEVELVEIDEEHHGDAVADEESFSDKESTSPEIESIASTVSFKPEVVEAKQDVSSSSSLSLETDDVNTSRGFEHPEPKTDDTVANSSIQKSVEDFSLGNEIEEREDSQMKEPVYDDWNPSEVEKNLSGITIIEEALSYVDKKAITSTSSTVSDMPMETLDISEAPVQVDRTIVSLDEELSVHDGSLEGENVSVGEEQWAATSHMHAVEENELRSREVTMINEVDIIKAGFSGNNPTDNELTGPVVPSVSEEFEHDLDSSSPVTEVEDENSVTKEANVQLEHNEVHISSPSPRQEHAGAAQSNVEEAGPKALKVSSEDSTSLGAEVEDKNIEIKEVNIQLEPNEVHIISSSPHPAHVDAPLSNVDEAGPKAQEVSSEDSAHIMLDMVHSSSASGREESQEPSSSVAVSDEAPDAIDASCEIIHGDEPYDFQDHSALVSSVASFPSEVTVNESAISEKDFENKFDEKIQNDRNSEDLENSNVSHVTDAIEVTEKDFDVVEELPDIDEEFLTELDAVGDFGVNELGTSTNQMENVLVDEVHEIGQVLEANSSKDVEAHSSKDVEGEVHKPQDPTEVFTDPQVLEVRSIEEVQSSKDVEDRSQRTENPVEVVTDTQARTVEEVHSSKDVEDHSQKSENPVEVVTDTQARSVEEVHPSKDVEDHSQKTEDSVEAVTDTQARSVEEICSSKEAEDHSQKTKDPVEAVTDTQARSVENLTPTQFSVNEMEDQLKTVESEISGEISPMLLDSNLEVTSISKEVMLEDNRASVGSNSNAEEICETSSSSNTAESEKKQELDELGDINVEMPETNTNETENTSVVENQESLAGLKVLEDNSSKPDEESSHKTQGSGNMEIVEDLQDLDTKSEEDEFFTPKLVSMNRIEEHFKRTPSRFGETPRSVDQLNSETEASTLSSTDEAPDENSSKDVEDEFNKPKDSVIDTDEKSLEPISERDAHLTPITEPLDEVPVMVKESSVKVWPSSSGTKKKGSQGSRKSGSSSSPSDSD